MNSGPYLTLSSMINTILAISMEIFVYFILISLSTSMKKLNQLNLIQTLIGPGKLNSQSLDGEVFKLEDLYQDSCNKLRSPTLHPRNVILTMPILEASHKE